jgi:hypothetical protein
MRSATLGLVCLLADTGILGYAHCRKWVSQVAMQLVVSSPDDPLLDLLLLGLMWGPEHLPQTPRRLSCH